MASKRPDRDRAHEDQLRALQRKARLGDRDTPVIARNPLLARPDINENSISARAIRARILAETEDRRRRSTREQRPLQLSGKPTSRLLPSTGFVKKKSRIYRTADVPVFLKFPTPKSVIICIRRKIRREVLHALRRVGSGGGKKRRRNEWSDIHC